MPEWCVQHVMRVHSVHCTHPTAPHLGCSAPTSLSACKIVCERQRQRQQQPGSFHHCYVQSLALTTLSSVLQPAATAAQCVFSHLLTLKLRLSLSLRHCRSLRNTYTPQSSAVCVVLFGSAIRRFDSFHSVVVYVCAV